MCDPLVKLLSRYTLCLQSYYKWILNMGNLTDSALKWSLRDSRAAILVAADAAPNPEVRRRILYEPFSEYSDLYRRCNVCYHPGHSCTVAHSSAYARVHASLCVL